MLIEQDDVILTSLALIAAGISHASKKESQHNCLQVMEQAHSSQPDLRDTPLTHPDLKLYTDGSSFMINGERRARYARVMLHKDVETRALPSNTSAQKAELIALTHAFELPADKHVNIYADSKYAFGVAHTHGATEKKQKLLLQTSPIKYRLESLDLLQAVLKPKEVAIIHCEAHQNSQTEVIKGN